MPFCILPMRSEVLRQSCLSPWSLQVTYTCTPGIGWGFPSTGSVKLKSKCLEHGNWSLTDVENCICKWCNVYSCSFFNLLDSHYVL